MRNNPTVLFVDRAGVACGKLRARWGQSDRARANARIAREHAALCAAFRCVRYNPARKADADMLLRAITKLSARTPEAFELMRSILKEEPT